MWQETVQHNRNRIIWENELSDFVPQHICDVHIHVFNHATLPDDESFNCAGQAISAYPLEQLQSDLPKIYPDRSFSGICFGWPNPGYHRQENNAYLTKVCPSTDFIPFRLTTPEDDPADIDADLSSQRFGGLKPYPDYVPDKPVAEVQLQDMLTPAQLEAVDAHSAIVMVHIPRPGRLEDPLNIEQIRQWCTRYPNARFILAHIGRSYYHRAVVGRLEQLADLPNLYTDTAMVLNRDVLEYALTHFPRERILWGTDIPLALAAGTSVEINHQYTYITPHFRELALHDTRGKIVYTSFVYEQLRALRRACETCGLDSDEVETIFSGNARKLLDGFQGVETLHSKTKPHPHPPSPSNGEGPSGAKT